MKRFVYKTLLFLVLFLLPWLCVFSAHKTIIGNQFEQNYNASILDKVERLCSLESPKIILVGNSNLAFGIQSNLLEEAFQMPVVNLGLHGGLGNVFHENMAKFNIGKGDIVVICHTSYADDGTVGDYGLEWITLEFHHRLWRLVRLRDFWPLLKTYPDYFSKAKNLWRQGKGNQSENSSYARRSFNEYGDIIYRPQSEQYSDEILYELASDVKTCTISTVCVNRLNHLNTFVQSRNAVMLAAGYPIAVDKHAADGNKELVSGFDVFEEELRSRLNCPVISQYRDYFMDYHLFYNTIGHLTEEGARIRTEQLISDLSAWMEESGYAVPAQ